MKNIKNVLIISLLAMVLGGIKIASAETFSMSYMSSSGGIATIAIDYGVNSNNYNPGDTIYPTISGSQYDMRCANGVSYDASQKLFATMIDFKIGTPGSYLTFKVGEMPWAHFDSYYDNIYLRDGTIAFSAVSSRYLQNNPSGPSPSSLTVEGGYFYINNDGGLYFVEPSLGRQYYIGQSTQLQYAMNKEYSTRGNFDPNIYTNPKYTLRTIVDYYHKGVSGTTFFNSPTLPGSILIPQNAEGQQYVAQVTLKPAWAAKPSSPTYSKYGPWVDATTVTYKTCPDGSRVASTEVCPSTKSCPDGSIVPSLAICPDATVKTCPDGSTIPSTESCPTITYKTCWDGSRIPSDNLCPASKTCPDGTVTGINMVCPRELLPPMIDPIILPLERDINDVESTRGIASFFKEIFNLKSANAIIDQMMMEIREQNGGGGYTSSGTSYTTPPPSCGSAWWCSIEVYPFDMAVPFTITVPVPPNTTPSVLIK